MDMATVLLIDEDDDSLQIFSLVLQHAGYRVLQARDGDRGFDLACQHQPDLVVFEPFSTLVPRSSLAAHFRASEQTARLQLLAVTAAPGLLEGDGPPVEFLVKPCRPRDFLSEVRRRLDPTPTAA